MPTTDVSAAPGRSTEHSFASRSVPAHLARGVAGFVPLLVAWWAWPRFGWVALAPAAAGVVALRGCPTCWTIGLVQTVSRQRVRRVCDDDGCHLVAGGPPDLAVGTVRG